MAENATPKAAAVNGDSAAGIPFYEKQRQHLKELLAKKRALDKRIVSDAPHHPKS
jgi:chromatin modification-related protein EAF6